MSKFKQICFGALPLGMMSRSHKATTNTQRDSLELPHFSSSLPSIQSGSASQCQRMGMQWPFLHWNWSLSHFKSQSCCGGTPQTRDQHRRSQGTMVERSCSTFSFYLVRSISTVMISVALPPAGNAAAICAGKLAFRALTRHCSETMQC